MLNNNLYIYFLAKRLDKENLYIIFATANKKQKYFRL